ncbi:MAG: glycosyltransferase family 4 protein [Thiohalocapsa sp.]
MIDRFNALALRGNVKIEVWFSDLVSSSRSWDVDPATWHFSYRVLPKLRLPGTSLSWVLPAPMLTTPCDIVISLYSEPAFILGWMVARIRGKKTGFRVLKTFDRWTPRSRLRSAIKRFMFSRADAIETPGPDARQYAIDGGARPDRIYYLPHTVDLAYLQSRSTHARQNREATRKALGLKGVVFLYVGRLWWGKGVDSLIDAFSSFLRKTSRPTSLLIVGDGPPEEEARLHAKVVRSAPGRVIFAGFQQKQNLPDWYALADVFVFPTLGDPYGIVIEEAMACSLPIISTDAAGDISARIKDGINGYIVPSEAPAMLAAAMSSISRSDEFRQSMGRAAAASVVNHTPEQWAMNFEDMTRKTLRWA